MAGVESGCMSMDDNPLWNVERQLERLQQQFEDTLQLWGGEQFEMPQIGMSKSRMGVDLVDRGEEFVLTADVPGFETGDIDLRLSENTLHITADREHEQVSDDAFVIKNERRRQTLRRSVRLPEPVDDEGTEAVCKNGVLTVTLPKVDASELDGKSIEIHD